MQLKNKQTNKQMKHKKKQTKHCHKSLPSFDQETVWRKNNEADPSQGHNV